MSKLSLLDLVQDILSDMSDDEVSSISDTSESLQVAQIVKSTFFEIIDGGNWPHLKKLLTLQASADSELPTHMKLPTNVKEMSWVEYDKKKGNTGASHFVKVKYCNPDEFLLRMSNLDSTKSNVKEVIDHSGVRLFIRNDKQPEYWTTFDDDFLVFDSYDNTVEATLQSHNTRASGYVTPTFTMNDSFVPDLPAEMFSLLLAESKSSSMFRLKEVIDRKSEQQSGRQLDRAKRKSWRVKGGMQLPTYARRSRK